MTNYKKIADVLQNQPVDRKELDKKEFDAMMKHRGLTFIQNIDEVNGFQREVWGNRNFELIVLHSKDNKFQIL